MSKIKQETLALTDKQRAKLQRYLEKVLGRHEAFTPIGEYSECHRLVHEIALAALAAAPYIYRDSLGCYVTPRKGEKLQREGELATPLYTAPPVPALKLPDEDYFSRLVRAARERADKAMRKFPQPNYVLNKVAEESGEVIKAVIHYTEGREDWLSVEGELIDNLAMLIRLVKDGDQVIGFNPPEEVKRLNGITNGQITSTSSVGSVAEAELPTGEAKESKVIKMPQPQQAEDDSWWYDAMEVDAAIRAAGYEVQE